jgi:hypothetical protein
MTPEGMKIYEGFEMEILGMETEMVDEQAVAEEVEAVVEAVERRKLAHIRTPSPPLHAAIDALFGSQEELDDAAETTEDITADGIEN